MVWLLSTGRKVQRGQRNGHETKQMRDEDETNLKILCITAKLHTMTGFFPKKEQTHAHTSLSPQDSTSVPRPIIMTVWLHNVMRPWDLTVGHMLLCNVTGKKTHLTEQDKTPPSLIWQCLQDRPMCEKLFTVHIFSLLFGGCILTQAASSVSFSDFLHFPKCIFNNLWVTVPEFDELTVCKANCC